VDWFVLFLVAAASIAVARVVYQVRRTATHRADDWDAKLIERLRRGGVDPFQPLQIDFFIAMPTLEAARTVAGQLEADGYAIEMRESAEGGAHPVSVHAVKSMHLHVPVIRAASQRLRELAEASGGRYDGWAPGKA
jgi:regulator of RNase E activity RraB